MQKFLASIDIIYKRTSLMIPSVVTLKEKSYPIKRHAGFSVCPRIMSIYMKEQLIHSQSKVMIEKWFYHCWSFIPDTSYLCKTFSLNDRFSIYVSATYCIEHIARFIMSWRIQPKLAHRNIRIFVMFKTISNKRRRNTLMAHF